MRPTSFRADGSGARYREEATVCCSKEIAQVAADLKAKSKSRPYVKALMPYVVEDDSFWRMLIEI